MGFKAVLKLGAMARREVEEVLERERFSLGPGDAALGFARGPGPGGRVEVREITHAAVLEALGRAATRLAPLVGGDCQVFGYFPRPVPFAVASPLVCVLLGLRQSFAPEAGDFWLDAREVKPRGVLTTAVGLAELLDRLGGVEEAAAGGNALRRAFGSRVEWVAVDGPLLPRARRALERAGVEVMELGALAL